MFKTCEFDSWFEWNTLLLIWAIHGNEKCWTHAIYKVIKMIHSEEIILKTWKIVCIPVANPQAYKENIRYCELDLNRCFKPWYNKYTYEGQLAMMIRKRIDACDYMIDVHSIDAGDARFVFKSCNQDLEVNEFAKHSLVPEVLVGTWNSFRQWKWATENYAHISWKKGLCIECWQHNDPNAVQVAYDAIMNILKYLSIIQWTTIKSEYMRKIKLYKTIYKKKEWVLRKNLRHWDCVSEWDIVATYDDNSQEIVRTDGIIILPKSWANVWEQRLSLWKLLED